MSHLVRPYTMEEIRSNLDTDGYIRGEVVMELNEIINNDLEGFLDLISERLVGSLLLSDISYAASGVSGTGEVVVEVTGDPSDLLNN